MFIGQQRSVKLHITIYRIVVPLKSFAAFNKFFAHFLLLNGTDAHTWCLTTWYMILRNTDNKFLPVTGTTSTLQLDTHSVQYTSS